MRKIICGIVIGVMFSAVAGQARTFVESAVGSLTIVLGQEFNLETHSISPPFIAARLTTLDANHAPFNSRDIDVFSLLTTPEKAGCLTCFQAAKVAIKTAESVNDAPTITPVPTKTKGPASPTTVRTP